MRLMTLQDFVEKQPAIRHVSNEPNKWDIKPDNWPEHNNTFRNGLPTSLGAHVPCGDAFFQHGSLGRGCVRGGCKVTLSAAMDPISKAFLFHGGICTTNNFKTIGKDQDLAGHEMLANLNAFVAIEYCMQLNTKVYEKMVPDWVRHALNFDLFCVGCTYFHDQP